MELIQAKKKQSGSSNMIAPGFRFHPTDEELVRYYLRRKVCGKGFRIDAISDIDIYKTEPWDLPSMSRLQTRDIEWYFFSVLDKKYGNGSRTNRATEKGYWKTTGKDRAVYHRSNIVGMKKTLVYHEGRAPKGLRSNWVMHEYRLTDQELERAGIAQDAFVLCRVFQKSGTGPKNGERYGAPFVEEEWEDNGLELVHNEEAPEEFDFSDDVFLDSHDIEQILGSDIVSDVVPLQLNFPHADGSYDEETTESIIDAQNVVVSKDEHHYEQEQHDLKNIYDLPNEYDMEAKAVKHEYMGESSKSCNLDDLEYLLNEPFMDASDLKYIDGGFIEANDIPNAAENDASAFDMLDEYFTYFDTNTDDSQFLTFDPESMLGADLVSDQASFQHKEPDDGMEKATSTSQNGKFTNDGNNYTKLTSGEQELTKYKSDFDYPFLKQASQMLGSISSPQAFAAEFPSKDAIRRLNSAAQSSSQVTAGMMQIRNMNIHGTDPSSDKHGNLNIILSFGLAQGEDGSTTLESSVSMLPWKTCWVYFMFLWVLVLSISYKVGTFVCAN